MILYYNGSAANHGCEAIVRSTRKLLGDDLISASFFPDLDRAYGLDSVVRIIEDRTEPLRKGSFKWLVYAISHKLTGSEELYTYFSHESFFKQVKRGDVCLSVGGDNYCYPQTDILSHYNRALHTRGAKTVLWGCSVEPELVKNDAIARDLSRYDLITARESISYEALKGVNPNTILVSDPAFVLDRVDLALPEGWLDGKMIGINASPLILQSSKDGTLVMQAYEKLIRYILDTTDCSVALIPHVVCAGGDDREPLGKLYEVFQNTGRVILLDDHNCMELKGYIARCRMFIGARTHATIAAYSSCVPTLVLGYSVKSRGIARDLFGTETGYVIPAQELTDADALAAGFQWLLEREDAIRAHLKDVMPEYVQRAYTAAEELKKLL